FSLLLITSASSLFSMHVMRKQADFFGSHLVPATSLVKDVHRGIYQYHLSVRRVMLGAAQPSETAALAQRIEQQLAALEPVLAEGEAREFLDSMKGKWTAYLQETSRAQQAAAGGNPQAGMQIMGSRALRILLEVEELMAAVDSYIGGLVAQASERVASRQRTSIVVFIGLLLVAVAVAGFVSISVSRSFAARAGRLRQAFAQIAAGDLSVTLPARGKDELAELARDFNAVCSRLRADFAEIGVSMRTLRDVAGEVDASFARTAGRAPAQQDTMDDIATALDVQRIHTK